MVIALATIMLVRYGVQEALASAQGGPGFSLAKFISFFVLITFGYCFVKFCDSSIPGIGYSLRGFFSGAISRRVDTLAATRARKSRIQSVPARKPGTFIH